MENKKVRSNEVGETNNLGEYSFDEETFSKKISQMFTRKPWPTHRP